jgi:hypothetical protein
MSTPLAGGVQAILQAACLSSPLSNSTPVLRGALCPSSHICCQGSFPYTPIQRRSRMSRRKKIAPATNISCSKYYICYVPGPTCRGSIPLYVPPFSYKRGGTQRNRLKHTYTLTCSYMLNILRSGVGCYAPAARTTLNPCVFLCPPYFPTNKQNA